MIDENDTLQDKVLELKGLQAERGFGLEKTAGGEEKDGHNTSNQSLPEFERTKMKQAIDDLNGRCRTLRD